MTTLLGDRESSCTVENPAFSASWSKICNVVQQRIFYEVIIFERKDMLLKKINVLHLLKIIIISDLHNVTVAGSLSIIKTKPLKVVCADAVLKIASANQNIQICTAKGFSILIQDSHNHKSRVPRTPKRNCQTKTLKIGTTIYRNGRCIYVTNTDDFRNFSWDDHWLGWAIIREFSLVQTDF